MLRSILILRFFFLIRRLSVQTNCYCNEKNDVATSDTLKPVHP